jgi:hypothetical protein
VNFFGHALVASWRSAHPAFALGSMLPDFATMVGARAETDHPELSAGIAFHHATDRAFHRIPAFRTLESETTALLAAAGLGRGPSRGAAHVSVELCLDAALVDEPNAIDTYLAALALAPDMPLSWSSPDALPRWHSLHTRLLSRGAPQPDPAAIATRVTYALSSRPLLSLDPASASALSHHIPSILSATRLATPTILSALRTAL